MSEIRRCTYVPTSRRRCHQQAHANGRRGARVKEKQSSMPKQTTSCKLPDALMKKLPGARTDTSFLTIQPSMPPYSGRVPQLPRHQSAGSGSTLPHIIKSGDPTPQLVGQRKAQGTTLSSQDDHLVYDRFGGCGLCLLLSSISAYSQFAQ